MQLFDFFKMLKNMKLVWKRKWIKRKKANAVNYLGKEVILKIVEPLGSRHPQYGFIYMINYRYVPDPMSGDGEELDAYLIGKFEPVPSSKGRIIAVMHGINDDDDKLAVSKNGEEYLDEAIRALTELQERFFHSVIIR